MMKPQVLLYACRASTDSKEIGDIVRKLAGQDNVKLSPSQEFTYKMILMDDEDFEIKTEEKRERERIRKAEYRAKQKAGAGNDDPPSAVESSATVAPAPSGSHFYEIAPSAVDGQTVDWSKVDISDDGMFDEGDPVLKACKVTGEYNNPDGRGWWRRWIKEYPEGNGETEFRQALFDAMREIRAGESLGKNPPAVLNKRLKKRFVPSTSRKRRGGAS